MVLWVLMRNLKNVTGVDCEQPLFFLRLSESNARARERRSRETRETGAGAREEKRDCLLRDGPLENLWGGRAKYKKNIRARQN